MSFIKKFLENQVLSDIKAIAAVAIVVVDDVESKFGPGGGADKKAAAVEAMLTEFRKEGGIDIPKWLEPVLGFILPMLVQRAYEAISGK